MKELTHFMHMLAFILKLARILQQMLKKET